MPIDVMWFGHSQAQPRHSSWQALLAPPCQRLPPAALDISPSWEDEDQPPLFALEADIPDPKEPALASAAGEGAAGSTLTVIPPLGAGTPICWLVRSVGVLGATWTMTGGDRGAPGIIMGAPRVADDPPVRSCKQSTLVFVTSSWTDIS
jgi:hypothetical protein